MPYFHRITYCIITLVAIFIKYTSYRKLHLCICVMKYEKPLLTKRETDIVILICKEYSNKQIAGELKISPHTVLVHKKTIRTKTRSFTLVGIALYAAKHAIYIHTLACIVFSFLGGDFCGVSSFDMAA